MNPFVRNKEIRCPKSPISFLKLCGCYCDNTNLKWVGRKKLTPVCTQCGKKMYNNIYQQWSQGYVHLI